MNLKKQNSYVYTIVSVYTDNIINYSLPDFYYSMVFRNKRNLEKYSLVGNLCLISYDLTINIYYFIHDIIILLRLLLSYIRHCTIFILQLVHSTTPRNG